jgi:hypothetical protein
VLRHRQGANNMIDWRAFFIITPILLGLLIIYSISIGY